MVPTVVKLFANTDRQMRIPLLERLPTLVPHLTAKTINDAIFQARAERPPATHPPAARPFAPLPPPPPPPPQPAPPSAQHISLGFVDTSAVLRELTVKAIVPLAPKLRPNTMNHVMRAFAKLQTDEEQASRRAIRRIILCAILCAIL